MNLKYGGDNVSKDNYEGGKITLSYHGTTQAYTATYNVKANTFKQVAADEIVVEGSVASWISSANAMSMREDDDRNVLPAYLFPGPIGMNAYAEAYITPTPAAKKYRDGYLSFERNVDYSELYGTTGLLPTYGKDLETSSLYWTQLVVAAFEGPPHEDLDPDDGSEPGFYGVTPIGMTVWDSGECSIVFLEAIRDDGHRAGVSDTSKDITVTHEIGHGAIWPHYKGTPKRIMSEGAPKQAKHFSEFSIDIMRKYTIWGDY